MKDIKLTSSNGFDFKKRCLIGLLQCQLYWRLMRFDKPIGIFLVLWPTLWALWIAAQGAPNLSILIIFVLGTLVMRAAGCVINDIADRRFDLYVERTRQRPLTTQMLSVLQAVILAGCLLAIALFLVLLLNRMTLLLASIGVLLTILYPLLKRVTHLPQLGLGFAFSWGIILAFAAELGYVPMIAWALLVANICWTMAYDTEYALVDREDDRKLQLKSTAILFGRYNRLMIALLQGASLLLLLMIAFNLGFHSSFLIGWLLALATVIYQQRLLATGNRQQYFLAFLNNTWFGAAIFIGVLLGTW